MIFVAFDKRQRNAGTYTSQSIAATPTLHIDIRGELDLPDRQDPTLEIRLAIEGSYEINGTNWITLKSYVYRGGFLQDDGTYPNPGSGFGPPPPGIQRIRGIADLNKRISIGVEVDLV